MPASKTRPEGDASAADAKALWRAKREARREKQRAENIVRAQKMHIERLTHEASAQPAPTAKPHKGKAYVGCSGWFYWHWRGSFYPEASSSSGWFDHYAQQFDTVELNAPFYSWPTLATVAGWKRQCEGRPFVYSIKVNELITHTKRFTRTGTLVKDFGLIAEHLGERFGCFLFQLPPSFHYSATALRRILKQLDPRWRNVVEFRHRSWWNDKVYAAFREHKAIFCSASGPRLPDELVRTADDVYIRFHGPERWYRHDYSPEEITVWAQRIRESGAKTTWAYFNNDRECYAIKNAHELLRQLQPGGAKVPSKQKTVR